MRLEESSRAIRGKQPCDWRLSAGRWTVKCRVKKTDKGGDITRERIIRDGTGYEAVQTRMSTTQKHPCMANKERVTPFFERLMSLRMNDTKHLADAH